MDNSIQTSFIPKQTLTNRAPVVSGSSGGTGLFTLLTIIILVISLVAAGGAYAYRSYLQARLYSPCQTTSQVQGNNSTLGQYGDIEKECGLYASLEEMRRRLDDERLTKMQRLDNKMKMATKVLSGHLSLAPLFELLSTSTLKTIRYNKFSSSNGQISLSGTASGYEDIAVQSNVLNSMRSVKDALFSNLDLDPMGKVAFTLTFSVNPSFLRYEPTLPLSGSLNN
ncbi:MAG: hypothetical protein NTY66_00090 [Candidatus Vogelbacteria bacterium]|nr:hypothetical protein [Candidatus Vogelbacteria bacterium]